MPKGSSAIEQLNRGSRIQHVLADVASRRIAGEAVSRESVIQANSDLMPELALELDELDFALGAYEAAAKPESIPEQTVSYAHRVSSDRFTPSAAPTAQGYDIQRELHRGGQGVVYLAVQKSTRRRVALKLLLDGQFASPAARRRFEREIELVAALRHPNIVTVFDSGATSDGRQYCVMDYIDGAPFDAYVREHQLDINAVLRLFCAACRAVNYAHQNGIIHRDIKPSNILVDRDGEPKVLDFGLAKQSSDQAMTQLSVAGQILGTLPYMSPELARGQPVDIRSDVYALGVMLYQVLTGTFPYRVDGAPIDVLQCIAEIPPTPPAEAWSAEHGIARSDYGRYARSPIDDEIQTIMLTALAKDPERRYQSVGNLLRDIERYLVGDPIEAKRDSRWYVLKKTVQKHKLAVTVAAAFVIVVVASAISLGLLYGESRRQTRIAEQQRHRAQLEARKSGRFQEHIHGVLTSGAARNKDITMREVVDLVANNLDSNRANPATPEEGEVQAALRSFIGETYTQLNQFDSAGAQLSAAIGFQRSLRGESVLDLAESLDRRAELELKGFANLEAAERVLLESQALRARVDGSKSAKNSRLLGEVYYKRGDIGRAWEEFESEYMELISSAPDDPAITANLNDRAYILNEIGDYTTAEALYRYVVDLDRQRLGNDHTELAATLNNLGMNLLFQGFVDLAADPIEEALAIRRAAEDKKAVANSLLARGYLHFMKGDLSRAEIDYRDALAIQQSIFDDSHDAIAGAKIALAAVLVEQGLTDQADALYEQAVNTYIEVTGSVQRFVPLLYYHSRGKWHRARGDYVRAEQLFDAAIVGYQGSADLSDLHVAAALLNKAQMYHDQGEWLAAAASAEEAVALRRTMLGDDHPATASALILLADFLHACDEHERETRLITEATEIREALAPRIEWLVAMSRLRLARHPEALGTHDQAESVILNAVETVCSALNLNHPQVQLATTLVQVFYQQEAVR